MALALFYQIGTLQLLRMVRDNDSDFAGVVRMHAQHGEAVIEMQGHARADMPTRAEGQLYVLARIAP